jgi:hypothetical protein
LFMYFGGGGGWVGVGLWKAISTTNFVINIQNKQS